ncbi:MAG: hypothetical protein R3E64_16000 [Halioglobus sp.]
MKISKAKVELQNQAFSLLEIRKNPSRIEEYIVILYKHDGKSSILAYENNTALSSPDLEHIILMLKEIGFRKAKIYF